MSYEPFARGGFPVGVRTVDLEASGRHLTAEVWYPAEASVRGRDLDPATRDRYTLVPGFTEPWQAAVRDAAPAGGTFPFAVFSHGFGGHRRQSTFLATHLASHGWVVASVDHAGNTFLDMMMHRTTPGSDAWRASMDARPGDVRALIDAAADGRLGPIAIDTRRVAMTGHSFGGWTALRVVADEPRIAAVVALAPAIAVRGLRERVDLAWSRSTPTLIIAAARDSLLPLEGIERVHRELAPPATLAVLDDTDHMHFCDGARQIHELFRAMPVRLVDAGTTPPPFDQLAPARHGHEATMGLGLAHLDAVVKDDPAARAFVASDLGGVLATRGIAARVVTR